MVELWQTEKSNSHFAKIPCGPKEKAFQADFVLGSHVATSGRGRGIELGVRGLGPSPGAIIFLLWSLISNLTSLRLGFHTPEVREQDKVIHNILWPLTVIILYIYTKHLRYRESWNSFNTWYWEEPWFTIGPCQRFLNSFFLKHQNWTQKQARKEKAILSSIIISTFPGNLIKQILFALHFTCEKTEEQWGVMICPRLPTELGAELEGEAKTLI